jgi:outer membrane protein OmpA-like peptidoglycan-associated protein
MRPLNLAVATALAVAWLSSYARAGDLSVRLEPGAAFPISSPQSDVIGVGGGGVAKAGYGIASAVDLQAAAGGYAFGGKAAIPTQDTPGALTVGGGARVMRPHSDGPLSPWADVDMLYVKTGPLDRPGFAAAGGVNFPLDSSRASWIGPFVRYLHVMQPEKAGFDNSDGRFFIVGVGGELGRGIDTDRDRDGVLNDDDKCPDVPGAPSNQGCPIVDSDGDGIMDVDDRCPTKPGPADNQGCPYADADSDGVLDKEDACPHDKGPASNRGCPILDRDGDGFVDTQDRCPDQPGKVHGCPDPDGDGLVPPEDQCPSVAGAIDDRGCPKYKQIVVTAKKIELNQKIFFAFGKTSILSKSFGLLNEVAQAMKDNPSLTVRVEGHTDSVGSRQTNMVLSEGRAGAVMEYLVSNGVEKSRLTAQGFGPDVPLDTNGTADGRERNRRVEFVILDEKGTPTGKVQTPSSTKQEGN